VTRREVIILAVWVVTVIVAVWAVAECS